jgi:uncharacterized protein (TIGR00288 family)
MALFCDFENVALGVRDAKYDKFDIKPVLERLLLKGSIVVKKAYCDWDRYKGFKAAMHEASFELIEIPHVRQSGKNSADIRLVVDALDLCYTKSHVDTFVIISGDSDFSPLVSKLRENAKKVIGVGVKNSTSDLLVANCDEFIFYDDLVREQQRAQAKREARETREASAAASNKKPSSSSDEDRQPKQEIENRKAKAIAIAVETFDDLASERGESGKIWASVLKSAIKRRKPDFNESYYGFRAFGNLLEEAQARGLLEVGRDEKSGAFVFRTQAATVVETAEPVQAQHEEPRSRGDQGKQGNQGNQGNERNRRKGRNGRQPAPVVIEAVESESVPETAVSEAPRPWPSAFASETDDDHESVDEPALPTRTDEVTDEVSEEQEARAELAAFEASQQPAGENDAHQGQNPKRGTARRARQSSGRKTAVKTPVEAQPADIEAREPEANDTPQNAETDDLAPAKTARKTASRPRRARKTTAKKTQNAEE